MRMKTYYPMKRMSSRTRFEKEAKGCSEMGCYFFFFVVIFTLDIIHSRSLRWTVTMLVEDCALRRVFN